MLVVVTILPANEVRRKPQPAWLVLQGHGRSADSLGFEIDTHLDPVGDLNEGNAAVHPVLLTVKCHRPLNRPGPSPRAGNGERQRLGFGRMCRPVPSPLRYNLR